MTEDEALGIARNPYGHDQEKVREAVRMVCDKMESWKFAYFNMREFAISKGLDVRAYNNGGPCDGN